MSRGKNFVFTLNNYTHEQEESIKNLCDNRVTFVAYSHEIAPSTGTPHLQGYLHHKNALRFDSIRKWFPWHIEIMKGSFHQNQVYCSKQDTLLKFGTEPLTQSDGARLTNKERWSAAKEGRFEDLDPEHIKIYEYIHAKYTHVDDNPKMENYWICGPSGCGKSSKVRRDYPTFYSKGTNKWWDGYRHEDVVLVDDFDPSHAWLARDLKVWTDYYRFPAEVKGGSMVIRPKIVIVTSQYTIEECFRLKDGSPDQPTIDAINRRFENGILKWSEFFKKFINPYDFGNPFYAPNFTSPSLFLNNITNEEIEELLEL